MDLGKILTENLRNRRIALNLSQERVAEKMNIQLRHYQGIEGGERSNPTLETLKSLAKALDLEPWQLLTPGYVVEPLRNRADPVKSVVAKVRTRRKRTKAQEMPPRRTTPRLRSN